MLLTEFSLQLRRFERTDFIMDLAAEKAAIAEEARFRRNEEEIRQKKENEPRFNKLKEIIERVQLTVSEINELSTILQTKKRRCEFRVDFIKVSKCSCFFFLIHMSLLCRRQFFLIVNWIFI